MINHVSIVTLTCKISTVSYIFISVFNTTSNGPPSSLLHLYPFYLFLFIFSSVYASYKCVLPDPPWQLFISQQTGVPGEKPLLSADSDWVQVALRRPYQISNPRPYGGERRVFKPLCPRASIMFLYNSPSLILNPYYRLLLHLTSLFIPQWTWHSTLSLSTLLL